MPKQYLHGPTTWKVTQRNEWKEIANLRIKTTEQLYKVETPRMDDHQIKEEENGSVGELIICCLLTNCSDMFIFGTYWKAWYSMVCEQTCSCGNEMDKSLWQTFGTFDLFHSSHKWIQAILSRGWTQHNIATQDCFKTLILQETLKTQNQHQVDSHAFSEVEHLCQEVGCARNRLQFHKVLQQLR